MRVDLAAQVIKIDFKLRQYGTYCIQVLSNQVANGIRVTQGDEAEETATFVDNFDKFFDCLNVSNHMVGKCTRNTFKNPYRKSKGEDFRLKVSCLHYVCTCCGIYRLPVVRRAHDGILREVGEECYTKGRV